MTFIYTNFSQENDFDNKIAKTPLDYLYFSVVVQFTVGFGDISPKTLKSRILVITHIITSFMLNLFLTLDQTKLRPQLRPKRNSFSKSYKNFFKNYKKL